MKLRSKLMGGALAGALAITMLVPTAANAASLSSSSNAAVEETAEARQTERLSTDLETLFTQVMTFDESGVVSFDAEAATTLLGAEATADLQQQLAQGETYSEQSRMSMMATTQQTFTECMVQNSLIGLVAGVATGAFAELIRDKQWDLLAKKLLPSLARAGFQGGIVGIVGGLALSSVQCTMFRS